MASNTRDVDLVIRAKAEGERALKSITDGLKDLANVQGTLAKSGRQADGALTDLGTELNVLSKQVQSLASFKTLVENVDRAGAAVERLEARSQRTSEELAVLSVRQLEAAAATVRAKQAAEDAAAAYQAQRQQVTAVREEAGKASAAYQQQAAALEVAKTARTQANATLRAASSEEKALGKEIEKISAALETQAASVKSASADWTAMRQAAQLTGQSLGGVEASLGSVNAAAAAAAEKLALTKGAIDFRKEADNAQQLRDAAGYIRFWSEALNDKDAQEKRSAASTAEIDKTRKEIREKRAAIAATLEYQRINEALGVDRPAKSARDSAKAFEEAAKAEDDMAQAAERLRAQIDPIAVVQTTLNKQLDQARVLFKQGRISAVELAQAEVVLKRSADEAAQALGRQNAAGGKGTFFGLRPYELHSLSYQVNDILTQLGSGAPILQILAQQGGQVFQVFQRQLLPAVAGLGPELAAAAPELAALVIVAIALGAALKNAGDEAKSIKEFSAQLNASADGAEYNAKALAETAHQLDVYGGSLKDAREALKLFVAEGLNPDLLEQFGRAAEHVATVTGKKVPEAAKLMAQGFTGGYDAVRKLDQEFNFLTAKEREHIKAMFDSGDVARGRTEAFDIFYKKMKEGSDAMRGPWGETLRNFAAAWNNLVEFIKNSAPVQAAIELIKGLSKEIRDLSALLPGGKSMADGGNGATPEIARIERDLTDMRERRAKAAQREADAQDRLEAAKRRDPANADRIQRNFNEARARIDAGGSLDSVAALDRAIKAKEERLTSLRQSVQDTVATGTEKDKKALADVLGQIAEEELRRRQNLKTTSDADKIRIAGELAYRDAIRETGDVAADTARKIADARRKAAEDQVREQQANALNLSNYAKRVAGVESNGDNNARPTDKGRLLSTALGQGQFIESTWLALFKKHFPTEAARMSDSAILELRKRQEYSLKLIEIYAQENAKVLQKAGVSVNEVALYLAHFLGPKGAAKLLSAAPNTPVSQLLGADQITANQKVLGGKTAGQVIAFAQRKMGASEAEREQLDNEADGRNKLADAQRKYNQELDDASSKRQAEIKATKELQNIEALSLEQKYNAKRQGEIAKAIEDASQAATAAGTELSKERERQIRKEVGALYDLQHAEELHNAQMKKKRDFIADLIGKEQQRETLLNELEQGRRTGTIGQDRVKDLRDQIAELNDQIAQGLPTAEAYARALGDEKLLAQLDRVTVALKMQREGIAQLRELMDGFVNGVVGAFDSFAQSIANGVKPLKALRNAFLQFAADFLRQIARMILQQAIFNLISGFFGAGGGGASTGISTTGGGGFGGGTSVAHTGGVIGTTALPSRATPSNWFANAARYHTGGVIGLGPDEVPIIAKRNEEMLTEKDPRHRFNIGKGDQQPQATPVNLKVVNTLDAGDFVSKGLDTTTGEQAILNFIRANAAGVKAALG